jgi:outer membrane lipoprotein-sorting protein
MSVSESLSSLTHATPINRQGIATQLYSRWEQDPLSYHLRRAAGVFLVSLALLSVLFVQNNARAQDRTDLEKRLQETEDALARLDNYTAVFHRTERVHGKLLPEVITFLKFQRPFKIYMRWINPLKGQESLYVEGANHNKVRAHGTGLTGLFSVNLNPTGGLAMRNSRHSITEAGLENLVKKIGSDLRRGLRASELTAKDHGEQVVYGRKTREIEGVLPKDPAKGYYCYRCIVNLDVETKLPIKTQIFDREDQLVECYGYEHLSLNPGLSDKDFDPKNPEYHF